MPGVKKKAPVVETAIVQSPDFDTVLRRMLNSAPSPHKSKAKRARAKKRKT